MVPLHNDHSMSLGQNSSLLLGQRWDLRLYCCYLDCYRTSGLILPRYTSEILSLFLTPKTGRIA